MPESSPGFSPIGWLERFFSPYLAVWLAFPSAWFFLNCPPLVKDVDALIQLTYPPGQATILHFSPLYSFGARLPMYGIALVSSAIGQNEFPGFAFWNPIPLTDGRLYAILAVQHALLCLTLASFIRNCSRSPLAHFSIFLGVTLVPFLYSIAHSIGSEFASAITIVWLASSGLAVFRRPGWKRWLIFTIALTACIAARSINAMFAGAMPLALGLDGIFSYFSCWFLFRGLEVRRLTGALIPATLAAALGVFAIGVADIGKRAMAYASNTTYRSTVGRTALDRTWLHDIEKRKKKERITRHLQAQTSDPMVKHVIRLMADVGSFWGGVCPLLLQALAEQRRDEGLPPDPEPLAEMDRIANEAAKIIIKDMPSPLAEDIREDTATAFFRTNVYAFTIFPFMHQRWMLIERGKKEGSIFLALNSTTMFESGDVEWLDAIESKFAPLTLPYGHVSLVGMYLVIALMMIGGFFLCWIDATIRRRLLWALALVVFGAIMLYVNNVIVYFMIRYALPAFVTSLLGGMIVTGVIVDGWKGLLRRRQGCLRSETLKQEHHADQVVFPRIDPEMNRSSKRLPCA